MDGILQDSSGFFGMLNDMTLWSTWSCQEFFRIFWDFSGLIEIYGILWDSLGFFEMLNDMPLSYESYEDFWDFRDFSGFFGIFRDWLKWMGLFGILHDSLGCLTICHFDYLIQRAPVTGFIWKSFKLGSILLGDPWADVVAFSCCTVTAAGWKLTAS